MSVEFTLRGNRLSVQEWDQLLADWAGSREEELYELPAFEGGEVAHIWGPGSIRGAVLFFNSRDKTVDLRLSALSSREDWRIGFELLRRALTGGGGSVQHENGELYGPEMLAAPRAEAEAVADFCSTVTAMGASFKDKDMTAAALPLGHFSLPITADDLRPCTAEDAHEIEARLASRVEKYAGAYQASIFTMTDDVKVATWALIPTLIGNVDLVALPGPEGIDDEPAHLPLEKLKELLGARAEDLGEAVYLPQLDEAADKALLESLRAATVPLPAARAPAGQTGPDEATLELTKLVVGTLMNNMLAGGDPETTKAQLISGGLEKDMAESLVMMTVMTVTGLAQDEKSPQEIAAELIEKGAPETIVVNVINSVIQAFERQSKN